VADYQDATALAVTALWDEAVTLRGTLDSHCEEIAKRIWPGYSGSFSAVTGQVARTEGQKRTEEMIDATGAVSLSRFAAVMESLLTPANSKWQAVKPSDRTLLRNRAVRLWCDEVTDILFTHRQRPISNFQAQQALGYQSLGAFASRTTPMRRGCATATSTLARFSSLRTTKASSTSRSASSN
jgi:hypothetical protein